MNLIAMTDSKLAVFHHNVASEIARRTRVATNGHDAAAIIKGQEVGKRAVVVAAAGNHSLHFVGPPSTGKTMLRAVALELGLSETFESRPCPCGYASAPATTASVRPAKSNVTVPSSLRPTSPLKYLRSRNVKCPAGCRGPRWPICGSRLIT